MLYIYAWFNYWIFLDCSSRWCNNLDLLVLTRLPSAVAKDHGIGPSGYLKSFSRLMSYCCESINSQPNKFLSALICTDFFCVLVEVCFVDRDLKVWDLCFFMHGIMKFGCLSTSRDWWVNVSIAFSPIYENLKRLSHTFSVASLCHRQFWQLPDPWYKCILLVHFGSCCHGSY